MSRDVMIVDYGVGFVVFFLARERYSHTQNCMYSLSLSLFSL
jgi:hypothetical protein